MTMSASFLDVTDDRRGPHFCGPHVSPTCSVSPDLPVSAWSLGRGHPEEGKLRQVGGYRLRLKSPGPMGIPPGPPPGSFGGSTPVTLVRGNIVLLVDLCTLLRTSEVSSVFQESGVP